MHSVEPECMAFFYNKEDAHRLTGERFAFGVDNVKLKSQYVRFDGNLTACLGESLVEIAAVTERPASTRNAWPA